MLVSVTDPWAGPISLSVHVTAVSDLRVTRTETWLAPPIGMLSAITRNTSEPPDRRAGRTVSVASRSGIGNRIADRPLVW